MAFLFLDLETTGLESTSDEITEAAWIREDGTERQFYVTHNRLPNEWVLKNTDYLTRIAPADKTPILNVLNALSDDCNTVGGFVGGQPQRNVYIVGACIAFDDRFLRAAYRWQLQNPPYHYHVLDVEAMAMGFLGLEAPPSLKELRQLLGIPGQNEAAHTALADAREVKLIFDALRKHLGYKNAPI